MRVDSAGGLGVSRSISSLSDPHTVILFDSVGDSGVNVGSSSSETLMDLYTISRLASTIGVSVHVARGYVARGLVRPAQYTPGGYGLYDEPVVARLRLVRALFEAGISLDELTLLCRALDGGGDAAETLARLRARVTARRKRLVAFYRQLAETAVAAGPCVDAENRHT